MIIYSNCLYAASVGSSFFIAWFGSKGHCVRAKARKGDYYGKWYFICSFGGYYNGYGFHCDVIWDMAGIKKWYTGTRLSAEIRHSRILSNLCHQMELGRNAFPFGTWKMERVSCCNQSIRVLAVISLNLQGKNDMIERNKIWVRFMMGHSVQS